MRRFDVPIPLALVEEPSGELVLGIPGSAIAVARLAPGTVIDAGDAKLLARVWVVQRGQTLQPAEVDRVLAARAA